MLSAQSIAKYQALCRAHGHEISQEEAYEEAAKLLRLVELVYQPMTEAEYEQVQERRRATGDA